MNFSKEWEERYQANTQMSIWPWTDLVTYIHRYAHPRNEGNEVLELGCGAGANIPLFLDMGFNYHSVEGSGTIVKMLHEKFPQLQETIIEGDFTKSLPFSQEFDVIVDRASLIHNTTSSISHGLRLAADKLRTGGKFIGIDWFSSEHADSGRGDQVDSHTRTNLPADSHLCGLGNIHFFDRPHLEGLLGDAGFEIERLEHKTLETFVPGPGNKIAWWHFVAVKS